MNYPLYISRKLSLSASGKKRTPATGVAIAAVALSVAVMLAAIAIVTGFKKQITEKVVGFNSHMTLTVAQNAEEGGNNIITMTEGLHQTIASHPFVTGLTLQASVPAILKTHDDFKGVYMRGLEGSTLREFLKSNLESGNLPKTGNTGELPDTAGILISSTAARQLQLAPGDKIDLYFMSNDIRARRLPVAGVFNSHFDTYDNLYIYGSLDLIREMGGLAPNQGVSVSIDTDDFSRIAENTTAMQNSLVNALADGTVYRLYQVDNALNQGAGFFRWLELLDMNVIVVLVLMTIVACVTLISGMLIIILDKKQFIGLMKALGTPGRKLRRIFVYLALRVALTGMAIGNGIMLILLGIQCRWHIIPLDPDAYYIDFVPVDISWKEVVILNAAVLAVAYLTLVIPSRFVGKISPAQLLRGE